MTSLKNKNVIITGAGGGIGTTLALALARAGANIAVTDINGKKLQGTFERINRYKGRHLHFDCNVLDIKNLEEVKGKILGEYKTIDCLLNVAGGAVKGASTKAEFLSPGMPPEQSFFGLDFTDFQYTNNLNFMGSVLPTRVFGEPMIGQKSGNIINISSMGAERPLTKSPAYCAGKAAISNFTQWLAVHLSKINIRVNAIAPGFILTGQNRFLLYDEEKGELTPRGKRIIDHTPLGRLGDPEDLISTVLWLLSEQSSFITGAVIPVDGGFSAYNGI